MYLNKAQVKKFFHSRDKRISGEALELIDELVLGVITRALVASKNFKTVKKEEVNYAIRGDR